MHILYNARIYTMNTTTPSASALAIEPLSGKIATIGSDDFVLGEFGDKATKEDMGEKVILPGLTDAHLHLRHYALNLQKLDLFNKSREDCIALVAERVAALPAGSWILGHGWAQSHWADDTFPTATELDTVAPNHPVYLTATSLHAGWCNSAALRQANVTANTPDPENGSFGRGEDGSPNGMLFETTMGVIHEAIPSPSEVENVAALETAQQILWQVGLTGVHDFDRMRSFTGLQILHQRGRLKMRVLKHLPVESLDTILESGVRSGLGDDMLWLGGIKAFMDGALGPRTAAMLSPYEGEADNQGMLFMDHEELYEHGRKAALGGFPMTVHAIGDRANHETLQAYAALRKFEAANGLPRRLHRLEHAQLVHPDDFAKFGELGIIASVQPIHATSDITMADQHWGQRAQYSYAWRTLKQNGALLAFGSDAPVDSPNPFWGMHAAVTRQRRDGSPSADGWFPAQRMTLIEALAGYTTGAALAANKAHCLGQLARGYYADLIVLEIDLFELEAHALRDIQPERVMVNGSWVLEN